MSAQVEGRHRKAAMTALNSATRERHGETHPEVAAVAQLLANAEAAERERSADRIAELTNRIASIMHNPDVDGDSLAAALIREGMERERKTSDALRARVAELERAFSSFACEVFARSIAARADAAIVSNVTRTEADALAALATLGDEHRALRDRVAELERERDEAKRVALVADGALVLSAVLAEAIGPLIPKRDDVAGGTESRWAEVVKAINACGAYAAREQVDLAGLDSLAAAICDKSRLHAELDAARSEVERLMAEARWVPCSDHEPSETSSYYVTVEVIHGNQSARECIGMDWDGSAWVIPFVVPGVAVRVLAWRPLPAPWSAPAQEDTP